MYDRIPIALKEIEAEHDCRMLNAGGGVLVYGIAKDGTVEDLQRGGGLLDAPGPDLDRYRKIVHDFIKPPANIEVEEVYLENGELIFLFHVQQDYERLFERSDNEAVYLRVADDNKGPLSRRKSRNSNTTKTSAPTKTNYGRISTWKVWIRRFAKPIENRCAMRVVSPSLP